MARKKYYVTNWGIYSSYSSQTERIQYLLDYCREMGGGEVVFPAGVYYVAGLIVHSDTCIHLEPGAALIGISDPKDYSYLSKKQDKIDDCEVLEDFGDIDNPFSKRNSAMINIIGSQDVSIIGEKGSFICACDYNCPDDVANKNIPTAINVFESKYITLCGYSVIGNFDCAHHIVLTDTVNVSDLNVHGCDIAFELIDCERFTAKDSSLLARVSCINAFGENNVTFINSVLNSQNYAICFDANNFEKNISTRRPGMDGLKYFLMQKFDISQEKYKKFLDSTFNPFHFDGTIKTFISLRGIFFKYCDLFCPILFDLSFDNSYDGKEENLIDFISFADSGISELIKPFSIHGEKCKSLELIFDNTCLRFEMDKDTTIIDASVFSKISFTDVWIFGLDNPKIVSTGEGKIEINNGTDIKIEKNNA